MVGTYAVYTFPVKLFGVFIVALGTKPTITIATLSLIIIN